MVKVCCVCGKEKEHKSWRANTCNDCLKSGVKLCTECREVKSLNQFGLNRGRIRPYCHACNHKRSTQSRAKTGYYGKPEVRARINEQHRTRYNSDEEYRNARIIQSRDRKANTKGTLTVEQWHDACRAFNFKCAYCGQEHKLTMDHVVPVSKGGSTEATNIIPACQSCNSSKCDKDVIEWYTAQPFYDKQRLENIFKFLKKGGN